MARYITLTLPARIVIDGVGGGDVVFRELTLGEYLETDAADKVGLALQSFRGASLPVGADREEWVRKLPTTAGVFFAKAVRRFGNPTDAQGKAFDATHKVVDGEHQWMIPEGMLPEGDPRRIVTMRELTFGQTEDVLASVRAAKGKSANIPLMAAATGIPEQAIRDLPSAAGTLILIAYREAHSTTDEEDESFFGGAQFSAKPPKVI